MKLSATIDGKRAVRYAHSYIGIGLTPKVGQELNKTSLNRLNEIWIVLRALFILQPVKIVVDDKRRAYDSIIFSNVSSMSKVLKVAKTADSADGKFEISMHANRSTLKLISTLLKATLRGFEEVKQAKKFAFKTLKETVVQLDGEISTLDADTTVKIEIVPGILSEIV